MATMQPIEAIEFLCDKLKETKNNGLRLIGSGGKFMDNVGGNKLHFVAVQNLNINEERKLYVKSMENLLNKIFIETKEIFSNYIKVFNQTDKILKNFYLN